ncbi:MAG: mannose-1-phosphate guanylyltransferase [Thermoplasmatales archaeon]
MRICGVLLAGGIGSRFWPISRKDKPKQFLLNFDGRTFIRSTADRFKKAIEPISGGFDLFIVTQERYAQLAKNEVPEATILLEKEARNTAPAIALSVAQALIRDVDVMVVMPSDHVFESEEPFIESLRKGVEEANRTESIIVFGYEPLYPHNGYGYIEVGGVVDSCQTARDVIRFHEKPDTETAKAYLATGKFLWNMGVFCWSISTILEAFRSVLPEFYDCVRLVADAIKAKRFEEVYTHLGSLPSSSIDKALIEVAKNVRAIPVPKCGWSDVGNLSVWIDLVENSKNNHSQAICLDCADVKAYADSGLVVTLGVKSLVVVKHGEVVLVCDANRLQDVSIIPKVLAEKGLDRFA